MTWECPAFLGMSNYSHDICRYYNMVLKSLHYYCIIPVYLLYYYSITIAYSPNMDNLTNETMASHNIYIYILKLFLGISCITLTKSRSYSCPIYHVIVSHISLLRSPGFPPCHKQGLVG